MKYRNVKCEYKGMIFDSKRELKRYQELELLERAGEISHLQRQISFEVCPKCGKNRAAHYIADFVYLDDAGRQVVEDAKGFATEAFKLKKKLMLHVHGIEVREV